MGCGGQERDFKFWMPLEVVKGKDGEMRIGGIASDENAKDLQDEKVFVDGLDVSYLLERGAFNWNHGKEPADILGEIDKANKQDGKLHVEGFLYPHVDQAKAAWNLMRSMKDSGSKRRLGLSIEGKVKERLGKEVRKAWLKNIAITYNPINGGTFVDMLKSLEGHTFSKCEDNCEFCQFEKGENSKKIVEFLEKQPNPKDKKIHDLADTLGMKPDELESEIYGMLGDIISHGQGVKPNPKELEMGIKVEMEHTDSPAIAKWIAMAHLKELPDYYTRLDRMEKEGEKALEKGQKVEIDARVENLPSKPSTPEEQEGDESHLDRCSICGQVIGIDGVCNCDPRDEVVVVDKSISAGYDVAGATGGVSGSALRTEELDKKKKVTTYDERHLGLSKKDIKDMVKSLGYPDDTVAEYVTDLLIKAAQVRVKPYQRKGRPVMGYSRKGKDPSYYPKTEEEKKDWRQSADEETRLKHLDPEDIQAESIKDPYAAMEHERMRINSMSSKALFARAKKITSPEKLLNYYDASIQSDLPSLTQIIMSQGERLGVTPSMFNQRRPFSGGYRYQGVASSFDVSPKQEKPEYDPMKTGLKFTPEGIEKLATEKAKSSFTSDYVKNMPLEKRKEEGLGIGISAWSDWSGDVIMRIFNIALKPYDSTADDMLKKNNFDRSASLEERQLGTAIYKWAFNQSKSAFGTKASVLDKIKRVFAYALEDSNFHDDAAELFNSSAFPEKKASTKEEKAQAEWKNPWPKVLKLIPKNIQGTVSKEPDIKTITYPSGPLNDDEIKKIKGMGATDDEVDFLKKHPQMSRHMIGLGEKEGVKFERPEKKLPKKGDVLKEPGRIIERSLYKAWPGSSVKGSLGHILTQLQKKGKSGRVKPHQRIRSGKVEFVKEHQRRSREASEFHKLMSDSVRKWIEEKGKEQGQNFAKWLQEKDPVSFDRLVTIWKQKEAKSWWEEPKAMEPKEDWGPPSGRYSPPPHNVYVHPSQIDASTQAQAEGYDKEGWHRDGNNQYSNEASTLDANGWKCPKCSHPITRRDKTGERRDREGDLMDETYLHRCGAELKVFND